MKSYSNWVTLLTLAALGGLCLWASCSADVITEANYVKYFRPLVIAIAIFWAAVTLFRIIGKVAIPQKMPEDFVPELIGFMIFWVLVPPIWFFFEFFAYDAKWVTFATDPKVRLSQIKDYADFASKIWAAVVVLLVGLVSLKK